MKNKVITFGEIMLRLATPSFQRFSQARNFETSYGGSEANVAVSLANYGVDASFVSRLPNNDIAKACEMELKKYGVNTQSIIWGGERLGSYFLETGAVNRASKVIYDRAYSAFSQIQPGMINWDEVFEGATWFHWTGITPAVSQGAADACFEAIKIARSKGVTVSCDLNYRKNLWKYGKQSHEVMPIMVAETDIVLGNDEAAEKALHIKPKMVDVSTGHVDAMAYKLVSEEITKHFPNVKKVITTLRTSINANHNKLSGGLYDGKTFFQATEYDITHIVDPVGGGDSFMGGLIYGLLTYKDDKRALDFAVAASCLKHTIHGDFNLVTVNEVEALMKGDASGRVQR
jgi:2-dehydro-3-deoxygluconokinase